MSKSTTVRGPGEFGCEVEVVASYDAGARLERSLVRRVNHGAEIELVPELTRAGAAAADYTRLPEVTECEAEFGNVFNSILDRRNFFASRKVVERQQADGSRLLSVAPRLPEIGGSSASSSGDVKVRKYSLVQFFTDSYLREKYDLGRKVYESLREQALGDADAAASRLQRLVRSMPGCEEFSVSAGQYSRSKKWAKDSVRRAASSANPIENIMDCRIYGDKISIYGPGPETERRWSVTAPIWETAVAHQVHRIVQTSGTAPTMFALGAELTILAVDIHNGHSYECPTVQKHAGLQDGMVDESSPLTLSVLSAAARTKLAMLSEHLVPITVGDDLVATAVGIGRLGALVNAHVLDGAGDDGAFVHGERLSADKQVSRDLWIAKAPVPRDQVWTMRDPVPGEQVFIYHRVGGVAVASPLVTLRSADGVTLTMSVSSAMRPGMSGGAILALKDLAFLGVYEGAGATQAVGLAFTAEHFTDLCTFDDVSSVSPSQAGQSSDDWYKKFQKRGLGRVVDSVIDSLVPLSTVDNQHVGCALSLGGALHTTVGVDVTAVRAGGSGTPLQFEASDVPGVYKSKEGFAMASAVPQLVRRPALSEKVWFLARDEDGPYYTTSTAAVVHVALAGKSFVVGLPEKDDMMPLVGSAVVADSDGAVLGVYKARTVTRGYGAGVTCVSVTSEVSAAAELPAAVILGKLFPMLRPETWPKGVAEAVVTHASRSAELPEGVGSMLEYGFVGDAALKAVLGDALMQAHVPKPEWEPRLQALQSNVALSAAAERMGLARELRVGSGLVLSPGSKVHADALEAVAGAVFKFESYSALQQFAAYCGLLVV